MKWFSNLSLIVAIGSCCSQKRKWKKLKSYNLTIKQKILDMTKSMLKSLHNPFQNIKIMEIQF